MRRVPSLAGWLICWVAAFLPQATAPAQTLEYHVDPARGNDLGSGDARAPFRTPGAALARLKEPLEQSVTIRLAAGDYAESGGRGMAPGQLVLDARMRPGVEVTLVGEGAAVLNFRQADGKPLVLASEGRWKLENLQIGARTRGQREGIQVTGPALVELRNCRIRTGSQSAPGLRAVRGGRVLLAGAIGLNEDLHENRGGGETFCGIAAEDHGSVKFIERQGASLSLGDGSLSAEYYGVIELGCERARITSWGDQTNCLAINNSGRIDLHNTTTTLCARNPRNTPIGLEHDGHILAEGAKIVIEGKDNGDAIVLQKASSFFCNDVEIRGSVKNALMAYSGSTLLAGVIGDLGPAHAVTGSTIIVEKCTGKLNGPLQTDSGGRIIRPDGKVVESASAGASATSSSAASTASPPALDLPPLLRAARSGEGVQTLLDAKADPRQKGPGGTTALHQAAIGGHQGTIELLIKAGADPRAVDDDGKTPARRAAEAGNDGAAQLLRAAETKPR